MKLFNYRYSRLILSWLGMLALFLLLQQSLSFLPRSAAWSISQVVVLAVLLLLVSRLSVCDQKIPRLVLLATLIAAVVSAFWEYAIFGPPDQALAIARLQDDPDEHASRIFRQQIATYRRLLNRGSKVTPLWRYYSEVSSPTEAHRFVRANSGALGLVWGADRWLNLFFTVPAPRKIGSFPLGQGLGRISELQIVLNVPATGLSRQPDDATAIFLANLANGMSPLPGTVDSLDELDFVRQELALREAGRLRAFWSSSAHLAYPWFLLGNLYLSDALGRHYQSGQLYCALRAYRGALAVLGKEDNPELKAAVLNNAAVALAFRSVNEGEFVSLRNVKKNLRRAAQINISATVFGVWGETSTVAKANLWQLRRKAKRGNKSSNRSTHG